jgi:hypothetical protein
MTDWCSAEGMFFRFAALWVSVSTDFGVWADFLGMAFQPRMNADERGVSAMFWS